ncbi:MAG: hypothetical protein R2695_04645 [Acidimicrobiales bacterium]
MLVLVVLAVACKPTFAGGSSLDLIVTSPTSARLVWNTAGDGQYPAAGHSIGTYEVRVDGSLVATLPATTVSCTLLDLPPSAVTVEVTARSTSGEWSGTLGSLGIVAASWDPGAGAAATDDGGLGPPGQRGRGQVVSAGGAVTCVPETDTDGDRLPDWVETDTGIFVDKTDTGTDPADPDTDGDGIDDGDEVTGSVAGLPLPQLGADPLHKNIFVEVDWFDDAITCGAHSHRPSAAAVARFTDAFAAAPVSNPDGSTGVDVIVDYGQGGFLNGGTVVSDTTAPIGSINGGVTGTEYAAIKAANFSAPRRGYFHYAVHLHAYNTSSTSSGQAELPGDDLVVSLQCFESTNNTANTMMHELGHNLNLRHGGFENTNWKPNYNSVMNYRFQFPGVDHDPGEGGTTCDALGDAELDYSAGTRVALDESAVTEALGVCGATPIDWNLNSVIDAVPYARDLNVDGGGTGDGVIATLDDHDDWTSLLFAAVGAGAGAPVAPPEIISDQPVPESFRD